MSSLRERLEARRKRIEAGLPPPVAVTVTPAFLEGVGPEKPRVCVVCEAVFTPLNKGHVTCGAKACIRANNDYQQRQRDGKRGPQKKPLERRICAVEGCGREFTPRNPLQKSCGAERCKKAYKRGKLAERRQACERRQREGRQVA